MNRTKIEWVRNPDGTQGYSWNPIKGWCPGNCPYCYSHRHYKRFKLNRTIRLDEKELEAPAKLKESSRIFVGSMIDMYYPPIKSDWIYSIIYVSHKAPHHTYITLTKAPYHLSYYDFPSNWWIGVTIDYFIYNDRSLILFDYPTRGEGKRFISFEPLLSDMTEVIIEGIDWIIIGGLTPKPIHKKEWIDDIVSRADELGIPVFIKKNANYSIKREEFPAQVRGQ